MKEWLAVIESDDKVIYASLLKALNDTGMFLSVRTLRQPLNILMYEKGEGMAVTINQTEQLIIEIKLSVGLLKIRNVLWLIEKRDGRSTVGELTDEVN